MRAFLEIVAGPYAGKVIQLDPNEVCRVGLSSSADLILADDSRLSPLHFAVACNAETCQLFDLNSEQGTFWNGEKTLQSVLTNGGQIKAGASAFTVHLDNGLFPPDEPGMAAETPLSQLLWILRQQAEPLFALLDAARAPTLRELLSRSGEMHQSLYEGETQEELGDVAPYLVCLPATSPLLETLLYQGWGKSWGVYFTSRVEFKHLRKHFRFLQFVEDESGKTLYFRFYDPRVLRVYLPTCNAKELAAFFGPVSQYIVEDESPLVTQRLWEATGFLQIEKTPITPIVCRLQNQAG